MTPSSKWGKLIKNTIKDADKLGLIVKPCLGRSGWSITLPNGSIYHSPNDSDMIKFIRNY